MSSKRDAPIGGEDEPRPGAALVLRVGDAEGKMIGVNAAGRCSFRWRVSVLVLHTILDPSAWLHTDQVVKIGHCVVKD